MLLFLHAAESANLAVQGRHFLRTADLCPTSINTVVFILSRIVPAAVYLINKGTSPQSQVIPCGIIKGRDEQRQSDTRHVVTAAQNEGVRRLGLIAGRNEGRRELLHANRLNATQTRLVLLRPCGAFRISSLPFLVGQSGPLVHRITHLTRGACRDSHRPSRLPLLDW